MWENKGRRKWDPNHDPRPHVCGIMWLIQIWSMCQMCVNCDPCTSFVKLSVQRGIQAMTRELAELCVNFVYRVHPMWICVQLPDPNMQNDRCSKNEILNTTAIRGQRKNSLHPMWINLNELSGNVVQDKLEEMLNLAARSCKITEREREDIKRPYELFRKLYDGHHFTEEDPGVLHELLLEVGLNRLATQVETRFKQRFKSDTVHTLSLPQTYQGTCAMQTQQSTHQAFHEITKVQAPNTPPSSIHAPHASQETYTMQTQPNEAQTYQTSTMHAQTSIQQSIQQSINQSTQNDNLTVEDQTDGRDGEARNKGFIKWCGEVKTPIHRVHGLRIVERPPDMEGSCEYIE